MPYLQFRTVKIRAGLAIAGPNYNLGGGAPFCKIYFYNDQQITIDQTFIYI